MARIGRDVAAAGSAGPSTTRSLRMESATGLAELTKWLQSYERAWEDLDPDAAAALYTEDATYAWGPYEEPMRGSETIRARWADVTAVQSDVEFGSETLGIVDSGGGAGGGGPFHAGGSEERA